MTALDTELIPEIVDLVAEFGKTVTWRTYPSKTVTESTSEVTLNAPTDYSVKVTPPEMYQEQTSKDGRATMREGVKLLLASGAGTSDALAFTPGRTIDTFQRVIVDSKTWTIAEIELIYSGDLVAAYEVKLEA